VTPATTRDVADAYVDLRPLLFSIAYRMLSSVSEAEDIVQEAFVRYQRSLADGTSVESPKAYLSAVVTRLAIDHLKSARVRREAYVGEWLPEPLVTDERVTDPEVAEQAESLSMSFLVLLERLTPLERAVFLSTTCSVRLRGGRPDRRADGGNLPPARGPARKFIAANRPRFDGQGRARRAPRAVLRAAGGRRRRPDRALAEDVIVHGDGGGKVPQWFEPIAGADKVARLSLGWEPGAGDGRNVERHEVNGQPGAVFRGPKAASSRSCRSRSSAAASRHPVDREPTSGHLGPVESLRECWTRPGANHRSPHRQGRCNVMFGLALREMAEAARPAFELPGQGPRLNEPAILRSELGAFHGPCGAPDLRHLTHHPHAVAMGHDIVVLSTVVRAIHCRICPCWLRRSEAFSGKRARSASCLPSMRRGRRASRRPT
jgi:RNA polymerase sigma-70 factor (ECF subfamily)